MYIYVLYVNLYLSCFALFIIEEKFTKNCKVTKIEISSWENQLFYLDLLTLHKDYPKTFFKGFDDIWDMIWSNSCHMQPSDID
jgi:hypothetical protein